MDKSDFEKLTEQERYEYTFITGIESPLTRSDNSSLMANGFAYASTGRVERFPKILREKLLAETEKFISDETIYAQTMETGGKLAEGLIKNSHNRLKLYKRFYEFIKKTFV